MVESPDFEARAPMTRWLREWGSASEEALATVLPHLFNELHRIARREMRRERPDHTLQATALVSEAYLRLREVKGVEWESRGHFFAFAALVMRRVLVQHARQRSRLKSGGARQRVTLTETVAIGLPTSPDLLAVNDALEALAKLDRRKATVVELRFFAGFSVEETAQLLELSVETVGREWRRARAWLLDFLRPGSEVPREA